jgi:hypothetical protein
MSISAMVTMLSRSSTRIARLAVCLVPAIAACSGAAWSAEPLCPAHLSVEQRAVDPPAGFQPFDPTVTHPWDTVAFSDGPPDQMAWLAPDTTQHRGKSFTNVWTFASGSRGSGSGTWLSCGYTRTSLVLSRRLPDNTHRCEVRYDETMSPPVATALSCR